MATASRFKVVGMPGGMPRLEERAGWKPCKRAKQRAVVKRAMTGPQGVVCPGCDWICVLPVEVKAGMEFMVLPGVEQ